MKLTALVLFLLSVGTAKGQLNSYYSLGNTLYSAEVYKAEQPYLTEFGYVQYHFASSHLSSFFTQKFEFEKISYSSKSLTDSTAQLVERWKSSKNPEINPVSQFLDVKYTVQKVAYDSIITTVEFYGSEEYIGNLYKEFWGTGINLNEQIGEIMSSLKFRKDLIELHYSTKKNAGSAYSPYWITVRSTLEKPSEFTASLKSMLIDRKQQKDAFDEMRNKKMYHFSEIDTAYYAQKQNEIKLRLQTILNDETNITGSLIVSIRADTLGQNWIEVMGKNVRVNQALRESLLAFFYQNHLEKGVRMNTSDDFSFDYECLREEVVLRKSKQRIILKSVNDPAIEQAARSQAAKEILSHADLTYNVNVTKLNGAITNNVVTVTRAEYTSFGAAVGVVLLGGIVLLAVIFADEE